ncbi:MAG: cobalamin B12-binding domain-containing protein [Elusimicrobia bacterium]|nr:cobalamin B12-binding domain-containing protein [Elusimicrobiota bacterium]
MGRRVLLINPPVTLEQVYGRYASGAPLLPPLGFCYVASVLLELGAEVALLDCVGERSTLGDVRRRLQELRPDIVGLTSTTVSFHCAKQVLSLVKRIDPKVLTVLGGAHISALPRETMEECPELDFGVYGEGELTARELIEALADGRPLGQVKGLCWRQGGSVQVNPPRPNERDLDRLPRPARHLLPDLKLYSPNPFRGYGRTVSVISSRGCTFDCSYCDQSVFQRRWRAHGADAVLEELEELHERWGFDFFSFEDDHFLLNRERVVELCRKMIERKLQVGWSCSARANSFTPHVLELMRDAGCKLVYLGLESGSERMLKTIDKGMTLEAAMKGARLLRRHRISAYGAFMIGVPDERPEDIDASLDFALSLPLDALSCFIYVPYPGTPLRARALRTGFVSADWRDYSAHPARLPYVGEGFTEDDLLRRQRDFYRSFYLRPGFALAHLSNYFNRAFLSRAAGMLRDFLLEPPSSRRPLAADGGGSVACQRARAHT